MDDDPDELEHAVPRIKPRSARAAFSRECAETSVLLLEVFVQTSSVTSVAGSCQTFCPDHPSAVGHFLASSSSADLVPPWVSEGLVSCPCLFWALDLPAASFVIFGHFRLTRLVCPPLSCMSGRLVPPGCPSKGLDPPFLLVLVALGPQTWHSAVHQVGSAGLQEASAKEAHRSLWGARRFLRQRL